MSNNTAQVWRAGKNLILTSIGAMALAAVAFYATLPAKATGYVDNIAWTSETALYLPTSGITLMIQSGSEADTLTINSDGESFTVSVAEGSEFRIHYPGPEPGIFPNDGGLDECIRIGDYNRLEIRGSKQVTVTPEATPECRGSASGGGGGVSPFIRLLNPNGSQSFGAGDTFTIDWNATGWGLVTIDLYLSTNNGTSWSKFATSEINDGQYLWTVPNVSTSQAFVRADIIDSSGNRLAQDFSDGSFSIVGDGQPTDNQSGEGQTDPFEDPNVTGSYSDESARGSTSSINSDKGLAEPSEGTPKYCQSGDLIKMPNNPAVYYCGADGKRYVFPTQQVFLSWFDNFDDVVTISPEDMAKIMLGGNVTYKPGVRMMKIQSDPKTYAVARGGILRWVTTEAVARGLYGDAWNQFIDDINVAFFLNYTIGDPITDADVSL
ncbi:MAG: hypothetical protein V1738_04975 [Patescibacteria group bacterium]